MATNYGTISWPAAGGGGSGSNASVGQNGTTAPTSSTEIAGINPSGNLQPVSVDASGNVNVNTVSSTLPTGAATSALQTTGNTSLASIDTKFPTQGQKNSAGSLPVVIASDQTAIPTTALDTLPATQNITILDSVSTPTTYFNGQIWYSGTPTAGSAATFTAISSCTLMAQVSGTWTGTLQAEISVDGGTTWIAHSIHQIGSAAFDITFTNNVVGSLSLAAKTNFRIRATAAMTGTAVVRVIESFNPSNVYVANAVKFADSTGLVTGTVKAASTAAIATDPALVVAISPNNTPVLPTGAATSALQTTGNTSLASIVTNTTSIATSALQTTGNTSLASVVTNTNVGGTASLTSVASSATTVSLLAANTSRKNAAFFNDSTAVLYIAFAATSSTTAYTVQLVAGAYYELPARGYTGAISGIWSAANGNARITELT